MNSNADPGRAAWGMVALLLLANAMSFVDRMLLTLMVAPVRDELGISDTEISLLHGFAFAAFYAIAGLPLGRLSDRGDRTLLMSVGIAVWSAMTMACGLAAGFATLFAARIGVAIGEASLSPAAISLISERFPRRLVSRAIGVFQSGIFIGMAMAMLAGGALLAWFGGHSAPGPLQGLAPWRLVFIVIGAPGLLIALAMLFVTEPRRAQLQTRAAPSGAGAIKHMLANPRLYGGHFLTFTAITILAYGSLTWMATVLVRVHGLSTPEAGFMLGWVLLFAGPLGVMASGTLADGFARRGISYGPMLTAAIAALLLAIAVPLFAHAPTLALATTAVFLLSFAQSFPYGIASASLAVVTPPKFRGQATAFYLMISNLFGLTLGPLAIALMTDHYFRSDVAVGKSMALLPLVTTPLTLLGLSLCWTAYRKAWQEYRHG